MKLHCRNCSFHNEGNALIDQRIVPSATTELKQRINALRHREHCILNFHQQISPRARAYIFALKELSICIDRRERVAHIVGYRACQSADGRHPLCLYQMAWCMPPRFVSQIETNAFIKREGIDAV
jgi:hypothetical protein